MKLLKNIKKFRRNLSLLFKEDLKKEIINSDTLNKYLDNINYEIDSKFKKPKIKNPHDTVLDIINAKKSLSRFGDGELQLIEGKNIPFQIASKTLSIRLKEVISSNNNSIAIAIPRVLYSNLQNISDISKNFWRVNGNNFRSIIEEYISFDQTYYSSELTLLNIVSDRENHKDFFDKVRGIWQERDIVVIHGEDVFKKISKV